MRALLRPVTSRTTWSRLLHLGLAAWLAAACAMVWPGLEGMSARTVAGLYLAPLPVLALLACVPVVRRSEGVQARALLVPGDDAITVEPARTWAERGRVLLWLCARVWLGVLAGQLIGLAGTATVQLLEAAVRPGPDGGWAAALLVPAVVLGLVYAVAAIGALAAGAARRLLVPSAAERLAVQQARTERLLERNRLAAELHDSIGHALTVTVLQAGAARQLAGRDPAFVEGALGAIEESARHAAGDLERVLALLRDSEPRPPAGPTLGEIDRLLRSAEAAGARVDVDVTGDVDAVPPVVSREGYRIVQEALTNALRHAGPVPVRIRVTVGQDRLLLSIGNPVPVAARTAAGGGSGVRGLHDRAAVLGGTAEAGSVDDRWEVTVRLPLGGPA